MVHYPIKKIIPILFFSIGIFYASLAQEKIEKESGIKASQVPAPAKEWLEDAFENLKKPKWYLEISQLGRSYEAKFQFQDHYYSVEFDSLGNIQDVEIELEQAEVSPEVWSAIQSYFDSTYEQVKVEKIQRQLSGSASALEDYFDEDEREGIVIRYELVFQGKNDIWELWEGLFDAQGILLSRLKVQIRANDNLIF
ncbi:PepSY-like domain-containing protein [Algoriphagus litoralis]|uniref:PepSY-like domain-containing protein n=1 Tax=Algoriphagus litoralis TaxID=2202829 RepID=UPI000DB9E9CA|nr:PepSY-like domain-containing protein [Algoriphagus litoralis]